MVNLQSPEWLKAQGIDTSTSTASNGHVEQSAEGADRVITLTPASEIPLKAVRWIWTDRIPRGEITLVAAREGIGKSTIVYTLSAAITCGQLPGVYHGVPRSVIVAATEDSWEHTIGPRLVAAGADRSKIYRVDVTTIDLGYATLTLPSDLAMLERLSRGVDAAAILLDPLMSRLGNLDTHKDAEVRLALEPWKAMVDRIQATAIGLIHVNKDKSSDILNTIMGSRAFGAVPRAILAVVTSPDDESIKLVGQVKNNLGRLDLPTLTYRIEGVKVGEDDGEPIITGKIVWLADSAVSIFDAIEAKSSDVVDVDEAQNWLFDWLTIQGGSAPSKDVKLAGAKAGHKDHTLKRAAKALHIQYRNEGFPRVSVWALPGALTVGTLEKEAQRESPGQRQSEQSVLGDLRVF